jgi:hypothetical protein
VQSREQLVVTRVRGADALAGREPHRRFPPWLLRRPVTPRLASSAGHEICDRRRGRMFGLAQSARREEVA